ncbi:Phosphatidylethanolamine-binding protein PEBP [Spatholobus suberectus]|nr:Phosphatidylethanolamine-binding protein PEBP [Spatholobus suberectus]
MAGTEFKLVSPAIDKEGNGKLPKYCTQEGLGTKWDVSPPLQWHNVPPKTKSLALVVQDIDAVDPTGHVAPLTHWVVVNIPVTVKGLPEGFSGKEEEVGGEYGAIEEGLNDWKVRVWRGPKVPNYDDRFEFRLYALDDDTHFDIQN